MNKKIVAITLTASILGMAVFALWLEHPRSLEGFEVVGIDYPLSVVVSDGEREIVVMVQGVHEHVLALSAMELAQVGDVLNSRLRGMEVSGTYVPSCGLVAEDGTQYAPSEDVTLGSWAFAAYLREAILDVDRGRTHQQIEGVFERIGPAYIHVRGDDGNEYRLAYAQPRSEALALMAYSQEMKDAVSRVLAGQWVIAESMEGCGQDGVPWYCIVEYLTVGDEEGDVEWRDAVIAHATEQSI